jgi:hypothetical protein
MVDLSAARQHRLSCNPLRAHAWEKRIYSLGSKPNCGSAAPSPVWDGLKVGFQPRGMDGSRLQRMSALRPLCRMPHPQGSGLRPSVKVWIRSFDMFCTIGRSRQSLTGGAEGRRKRPPFRRAPLIFAILSTGRWALPPNPLICMAGIALCISIPPSACIPAPAPCCDLITSQVYACVSRQGGRTHGQQTEAQ